MWATGAYGYLSDYLLWWIVLGSVVAHAWCFFLIVDRARRPRLTLIVGNLLVTASLLLLSGLVAETYLRFVSTATDAFGTTLTSKRWFQIYPEQNSLLFRDIEWTASKPPGVRRVAFVGDSFTYGWGINDRRNRFTDVIQERFDRRSLGAVEVMNVAWVGWDSQQEAAAIDRIIPEYDVDEVVLCYLPNDIEPLLPVTEEFDPTKPKRSRLINTSASFLLDFLYHRVYAGRSAGVGNYWDWLWAGYGNPKIWREHTSTLRDIIRGCRNRGATLRVAIFPFIQTRGRDYDASQLHARLTRFFHDEGVRVVDLLPAIDGHRESSLVVNRHDPHPNELAHRLFAETIWEAFYSQRGP